VEFDRAITLIVAPAKAGVQTTDELHAALDSLSHGNDDAVNAGDEPAYKVPA